MESASRFRPLTHDTPPFASLAPDARLSDRVADALEAELRGDRIAAGDRLPTEAALAAQFGVSRTVVREAVSRLKSVGLVESRQGSGVYARAAGFSPLNFDARHAGSRAAMVQIVEVRRALESEVAALVAERRTEADLQAIRQCIGALDAAVAAGGDGVEEDVQFHRVIAEAARNPFLMGTLNYLGQFLHGARPWRRARRDDRRAGVDAGGDGSPGRNRLAGSPGSQGRSDLACLLL